MRAALKPPSISTSTGDRSARRSVAQPSTASTSNVLPQAKLSDAQSLRKGKEYVAAGGNLATDVIVAMRKATRARSDRVSPVNVTKKSPVTLLSSNGWMAVTDDVLERTLGPASFSAPHAPVLLGHDNVLQVRAGYPNNSLTKISELLGLSEESVISLLQLPRSTVKRQQSLGRAFSLEISDRLYRVQRLLDMSTGVIGDHAVAVRWLMRQHPALGGVTPLSLVDTTAGYERVTDELHRISYGVVA